MEQKKTNDYHTFINLVKEAAEKSLTKAEEARKQTLHAFIERKQREQHLDQVQKMLKDTAER